MKIVNLLSIVFFIARQSANARYSQGISVRLSNAGIASRPMHIIVKLFTPLDSLRQHSSFSSRERRYNISRITTVSERRDPNTGDRKNLRFSTTSPTRKSYVIDDSWESKIPD